MDRLAQRIMVARKAMSTLSDLVYHHDFSEIIRDAAIQRFEYTFEAVWKAGQHHLREVEGIVSGSPKATIRGLHDVGMLSEEAAMLALEMTDDRNLTVHTYNEDLANRIWDRLPDYVSLMSKLLDKLEASII